MNDRFKFRAWKHHGEYSPNMFYMREPDCDGVVSFGLKNNTLYYDVEDVLWDERFFTPLQCTGLKDKNGTLIYEGDIIHGEYGMAWEVFHENSMYYAGGHSGDTYITKILEPALSMVSSVIGNIYENPELLNK